MPGQREVLEVGHLDLAEGLVGDSWATRGSRHTPDGSADPEMQLNVMHHGLVQFLAQDPEREELAGDQMYVDLDLSHDNLPAWSELHIGGPDGAVIVVTEVPHNGCGEVHRALRQGRDGLRQRPRGQAAPAARAVRQGGAARAGPTGRRGRRRTPSAP